MFEMKIFGSGNKQYLTNMNPDTILGQGKIIRETISHVLIFEFFISTMKSILWIGHFIYINDIRPCREAWVGVGGGSRKWPET